MRPLCVYAARPQDRRRLAAGLLVTLLLSLTGCATATVSDSEPPPQGEPLPSTSTIRNSYQSRWEYRFGESPRRPDGSFAWAQPIGEGELGHPGWGETGPFRRLPDRGDHHTLWIRSHLHGPPLRDGALYLPIVDNILEAYIDGRLVYSFGDFRGAPPYRFIGFRPHFIPLPNPYQGKTLTLRVYSDLRNIGPFGEPRLAERADIISDLFLEEGGRLIIGSVMLLIGLSTILLLLLRRDEWAYLYYGGFACCMGTYITSQLEVRTLFFDHTLAWAHIELTALYLSPAFLCAYINQIFGRGPLGLVGLMKWLHLLYFVGSASVVACGLIGPWRTLFPFQMMLLSDVFILTGTILYAAVRGNIEARIFFAGFVIAAVLATLDLLSGMRLIPRTRLTSTHIGNAAIILALGTILARRFALVHKRLGDYSSVLQLSLASVSAFQPEERTQVALDELVRLFKAERALLFLTKPGSSQLDWTAGRDRQKQSLHSAEQVDLRVVEQAQLRQKPIIHHATDGRTGQAEPRGHRDPHSVMAAPLLARGELLGVVYLEGQGEQRRFHEDELNLLLGLANQVAIALISVRANKLELDSTLTKQRFDEQRALLDAAVRIASGDLTTPIQAQPGSTYQHLAEALDSMRRDLWNKLAMLESRNREVQTLNEELRHQIEQRSRRLMASIMNRKGGNSRPPAQLETGKLLVGRYRVLRLLGRGAMGEVYEVERTSDKKHFAAKLLSTRADRPSLLRFTREAQILARLSHRNLIGIADVDMTTNGVLFIVLELVSGGSLYALQSRFGQLRWALCILRQISDALTAIHTAGIVHRDLKPANVLIAGDPRGELPLVKLADFGVSLLTADGSGPVALAPSRPPRELGRRVPLAPAVAELSSDLQSVIVADSTGNLDPPTDSIGPTSSLPAQTMPILSPSSRSRPSLSDGFDGHGDSDTRPIVDSEPRLRRPSSADLQPSQRSNPSLQGSPDESAVVSSLLTQADVLIGTHPIFI